MRRIGVCLGLVLLLISVPVPRAEAAGGVSGKVGIGTFVDFNFPVFSLKDRFQMAHKWGGFITYATSGRTTVELEYHRSRFDPGRLQESRFLWPEDNPRTWRYYKSPLARNYMTFNSFLVNGLYHFKERTVSSAGGEGAHLDASPFLVFGGGFYQYRNSVSGLVYPGQPDLGKGIDETLTLAPFADTDVAWGFNIGFGAEVLMDDRVGFDIRGRFNFIIAELKPLEAYGFKRTYPMSLIDFGLSMKYYLGTIGKR